MKCIYVLIFTSLKFIYVLSICLLYLIYYILFLSSTLYNFTLLFKISTEINNSNCFPINSEIATVTKWSDLQPQPQARCVEDVMIEAEVSRTTQDPASAALISVSVLRHGLDTVDMRHF